jgi:HD-GYP domain-containing protein (c-di-GMP phosphodiesterase class II)
MTLRGRGRRPRSAPTAGRRSRIAGLLAAGVAAASLAGMAGLTGALDSLERATVATRFSLRHVQRPTSIVIVKIDDQSFGELEKRWPFPRSYHARLIDQLHASGAKEIVYDVQFTEPSAKPEEDVALYDAIGAAGGVTLATSESDGKGHTNVLGGDANLAKVHARAAAANLTTSAGGVITQFPYEVSELKSLAVVAAERATGTPLPRSRFQSGNALIDYRGGAGTFTEVPFWKVVRGQVRASTFRGKIVVVGATAPSLQDLHATPTSGSDLMPGPEVQANAIWTALHGNPLRTAPNWLTAIAILLAALAAPLAAHRLNVVRAALLAAAAAMMYAATAQFAFDRGTVLAVTAPLFALALGTAGMLAASYFTASSERRVLGWTVRRRTEQLRDAQLEIITRLVQAAESRDGDTGDHINRIGNLCERLALRIGFDASKAHMLRHASAMHDVGKIGIPDSVLLKPGSLDADEWEVMKSHTTKGADILGGSTSPMIQMAEMIARTHHERWDGSGYPLGLKGEEIPLEGRICAICDVYDALGSKRPYKDAWSPQHVIDEIARGSGSHFDPALVEAFLALVPELGDPEEQAQHDELDLEALPPLLPSHERAA